MKLTKASFEILTPINGEEILKSIELAGRVCYKSEDKITEDSAKDFVAMVLRRGHESVIEHQSVSVRIICDRGVSHEIVRHRIASYSQESTRYCNYANKDHIEFIIPCWLNLKEGIETDNSSYHMGEIGLFLTSLLKAEKNYKLLIGTYNWSAQQARSLLPNSLKTEIICTFNLREWRHFFKLRTSIAAHPQMREITIPMLEEFKRLIPIIFDDLTYTL